MNTQHKQVPTLVKAMVDEEIKDLVDALNELPGVVTQHSCQGHPGKEYRSGYVSFSFENGPIELVSMFEHLSRILMPSLTKEYEMLHDVDNDGDWVHELGVVYQMEWMTTPDGLSMVLGIIRFDYESLAVITEALLAEDKALIAA